MRPARRSRPQRTIVFLGCEGESEQGYGQFLNGLPQAEDHPFHIDVQNLNPGAGSPVALIKKAIERIERHERQRDSYAYKAVLIDADKLRGKADRDEAVALAENRGISIIWQAPCHEAFLLNHFPGRLDNRPASSTLALNALRQEWPGYQKGSSALQLSKVIDFDGVKRVAAMHEAFAAFPQFLRLLA